MTRWPASFSRLLPFRFEIALRLQTDQEWICCAAQSSFAWRTPLMDRAGTQASAPYASPSCVRRWTRSAPARRSPSGGFIDGALIDCAAALVDRLADWLPETDVVITHAFGGGHQLARPRRQPCGS
jgi:hypothetical protein